MPIPIYNIESSDYIETAIQTNRKLTAFLVIGFGVIALTIIAVLLEKNNEFKNKENEKE
ncbi:hypothetical protein [Psychroflexus planctonicus]|uniref:Uncharacterized protein n=1 Tax=Psychroflexus planctonicus TaxID=1526575 RepID=A0ABQ1SDQ6_9FLAO|nr:hypothetical protein [Psychroflexus planctonicus]GGE31554.1 hypothetical protein GCM10010832_09900 [Psychroflexus planctonicus]